MREYDLKLRKNRNVDTTSHDAAKNYATLYLPGYTVLTPQYVKVQVTEKHGLHTLWKAEAVNQEMQHGVIVWIREL